MSHEATNWAIKQRGLKPTTKIVLWHLCDRFNPDYGGFPSQDRLAEDCEISRSTLNEHLGHLEAEGLLKQLSSRSNALQNRLLQVGVLASDIQRILDNSDIIPTLAIRSPIAGTVIGFDQFLGKNIRSDQQLFSVQNLSHGLIQGFVPESEIRLIAPGQQVSVQFSSLPSKTFTGIIARTNEAILPEDRTQRVWIELTDAVPSIARQGMLATIRVSPSQTAANHSQ